VSQNNKYRERKEKKIIRGMEEEKIRESVHCIAPPQEHCP
jgi:hypothetical protein